MGELRRMRAFRHSLSILVLLPLTYSYAGKHLLRLRDGSQFLLETPNDSKNEQGVVTSDYVDWNDWERTLGDDKSSGRSCDNRGRGRQDMHGAPCVTGRRSKYAGRCCRGECEKIRTWIRRGCPKPIIRDVRGRRFRKTG